MGNEFGVFDDLVGRLPKPGSGKEIDIVGFSEFFRSVGYKYDETDLKNLLMLFENEIVNSPHVIVLIISNYSTVIHIKKLKDMSFLSYLELLYIKSVSNRTINCSDLDHLFNFMRMEKCTSKEKIVDIISGILVDYSENNYESKYDIIKNGRDVISDIYNNVEYQEFHDSIKKSVNSIFDQMKKV